MLIPRAVRADLRTFSIGCMAGIMILYGLVRDQWRRRRG